MRVLVVEDDPEIAELTGKILKSAGMVCDLTDLGEDAVELAKLYDFDLIVLDLILPDLDGHEVVRELRAAKIETPVLILSSLGEVDQCDNDSRRKTVRSTRVPLPCVNNPMWTPCGPR